MKTLLNRLKELKSTFSFVANDAQQTAATKERYGTYALVALKGIEIAKASQTEDEAIRSLEALKEALDAKAKTAEDEMICDSSSNSFKDRAYAANEVLNTAKRFDSLQEGVRRLFVLREEYQTSVDALYESVEHYARYRAKLEAIDEAIHLLLK